MGLKQYTKKLMLEGMRDADWNVSVDGFRIGAFQTSGSGASIGALVATAPITFGDATGSAGGASEAASVMEITNTPVLNVPAGNTIDVLAIYTGTEPGDFKVIADKSISPEAFTYAGTITITSASITLS